MIYPQLMETLDTRIPAPIFTTRGDFVKYKRVVEPTFGVLSLRHAGFCCRVFFCSDVVFRGDCVMFALVDLSVIIISDVVSLDCYGQRISEFEDSASICSCMWLRVRGRRGFEITPWAQGYASPQI